ncbi:MAG: glycosyltransferase family 10 [Syntrophomonas sp.]
MIRIKLSSDLPDPLIRQTPGSLGIWGDCKFFFNQDVEECDFWVVYDGVHNTESTICPPQNVILITAEPPSVYLYPQVFLNQFAVVVTCQRNINHTSVIHTQTGLPWYAGRRFIDMDKMQSIVTKDYSALKNMRDYQKSKLISVICSDKRFTEGHRKRHKFVQRLQSYFGIDIDVFGRGIRAIEDTWDAISNYRYHVVIENSSFPDYWTEKLADTFLAGAYPIYYGCTNLYDYFRQDMYTPINIDNEEESLKIIDWCIRENLYEKSIASIKEARDLILDVFNMFPLIANLVKELDGKRQIRKRIQILPGEKVTRVSTFSKRTTIVPYEGDWLLDS